MSILFYLGLCFLVAYYANKKGHSGTTYFLVSFFLSPLVGGLVAMLVSPKDPAPGPAALAPSRQPAVSLRKPAGAPTRTPVPPPAMAGQPKEFFVALHGQQRGPFTRDEVFLLWTSGQAGEALYWKDGMAEWRPLGEAFA